MSHVVELPEPIYRALVETAQAAGTTPAEWIATQLLPGNGDHGQREKEIMAADALLEQSIVSAPQAVGTANEQIDADLVREYGADHAALYRKA